MKKLLYFGCIKQTGHYLWMNEVNTVANISALKGYTSITGVTDNFIHALDGTFVPPTQNECEYRDSTVPPFRIVSWVDNSVDRRGGSHSTFLGIGYDSAIALIEDARIYYPSVMNRQKAELKPYVEP